MLSVRRALPSDMDLYFRWANDPVTRANSWNPATIPRETHERWFAGQLGDQANVHYVVESDGEPAGQVRFGLTAEEALIGFSLDPTFRGRGMGCGLLQAAIERFAGERTGTIRLKAEVKRDNPASARIFDRLGFRREEEEAGPGLVYRMELSPQPVKKTEPGAT